MNNLGLACAVGLAGVFLASVLSKLGRIRFRIFVASAGPLELVSRSWRGRAAAAVVTAELAVTIAFAAGIGFALFGHGRTMLLFGFLGSAALLIVFTAAVGLLLHRGERAPCHCFGTQDAPLGPAHLVRNAFLVALAILGSVTAGGGGGYSVPGFVLAAGAGVLVATLVILFDDLLALFGATSPARNLR